jgi:hypothetical protein
MALGKHEVQPLFAEPYLRVDMGRAITGRQIEYLNRPR